VGLTTPLELLPLFTRALELCSVRPGEVVGVYTENGARRNYADAYVAAAESLGATAFVVDMPVPSGPIAELSATTTEHGLGSCPPLVEAFIRSDLLIDLALLFFNPAKIAIQESGTRILTCVEPAETIARLFPHASYREEALRGEALLAGASTLRVTSAAGTDLTYQLGDRRATCQYGLADVPGRWDHFASAFVLTAPNDGGVDGTVVFDVGDVITPYIHHVRQPVTCHIQAGYIAAVEGGLEARFIEDQLRRFDRDARAVSHIGWGLHAGARWDALRIDPNQVGLDPRSFRGCVMFSTGPNNEFGGSNSSRCHFDMPMRNCSLWVDGRLVVDAGTIVEDDRSAVLSGGDAV
jgi:2,5-dihydroxypyridine 5,6-dioxygenase